jgi:hypothetical protein
VKDEPPPVQFPDGGWQIKPDLVVDGPSYDVPAKGIVEWAWFVDRQWPHRRLVVRLRSVRTFAPRPDYLWVFASP